MGDGKLRRVGAMWRPKPGGKSCGSGSITIKGYRQRFVVLKNTRKAEGSKEPDWVLMSSDLPERDDYQPPTGRSRSEATREDETDEPAF